MTRQIIDAEETKIESLSKNFWLSGYCVILSDEDYHVYCEEVFSTDLCDTYTT